MPDIDMLYERFPDGMKRTTQKWYYLVNPRLSWRQRRRMAEVDEAFIDRFFETEAEYRRYEREFYESGIVEICQEAMKMVPDDVMIYDAHQDACAKYYALVRKRRPTTLVETGVYNGVSTTAILLALEENGCGTLHSIDASNMLRGQRDQSTRREREEATDDRETSHSTSSTYTESDSQVSRRFFSRGRPSCSDEGSTDVPPDRDPGWIVPNDLERYWNLTLGRSQRTLPTLLSKLETVEFFLHDSEHSTTGMLFEFELAWEWLSSDGIILSNHVDRNDAFDTFVSERQCEHGLYDFYYDLAYDDYTEPCSSGFIVRA